MPLYKIMHLASYKEATKAHVLVNFTSKCFLSLLEFLLVLIDNNNFVTILIVKSNDHAVIK